MKPLPPSTRIGPCSRRILRTCSAGSRAPEIRAPLRRLRGGQLPDDALGVEPALAAMERLRSVPARRDSPARSDARTARGARPARSSSRAISSPAPPWATCSSTTTRWPRALDVGEELLRDRRRSAARRATTHSGAGRGASATQRRQMAPTSGPTTSTVALLAREQSSPRRVGRNAATLVGSSESPSRR